MSFSVNGPRNYNYYRLAAPADMGKDIGPRNYNYYRLAAPADMDKDIGPSVHGTTTTTARRPQRTWAAQGNAPVELFF